MSHKIAQLLYLNLVTLALLIIIAGTMKGISL